MICGICAALADYGVQNGLLAERDRRWAVNALLDALGISQLYLPLLYVQVIGAGLQVALMGVLNVFFYLLQRRIVLFLCIEFLLLNVLFTAATLWLGAALYGYGFTLAVLLTLATGLVLLSRQLSRLEYETFMLQ